MSELVLTLRAPLPERIDLSPLIPLRLAALTCAEIARIPMRFECGQPIRAGDLFAIAGKPSDSIRLAGDLSLADDVGSGISSGTLTVEGRVGRRAGRRMTGGRVEISGDAGDWAGLEMAGGQIVVRGNAGRGTGSASPGAKRGMTGGEIVIFGDAGSEAGACLRRGLIAIAGNVGPDAAHAAIAGTVVVAGHAASPVARWSKRATVVTLGEAAVPPTYRYACTYQPPFVALLLNHLRRTYGFPVPSDLPGSFHCYGGDLAETGRGEILCRVKA